jgi:hypothetical protein
LALSRIIWLTPLLRDEKVRAQIKRRQHALIVLGTADPNYDSTYLTELKRTTRNEVFLVEGADHSMEIQGDVLESVAILEKIMRSIQAFLSG